RWRIRAPARRRPTRPAAARSLPAPRVRTSRPRVCRTFAPPRRPRSRPVSSRRPCQQAARRVEPFSAGYDPGGSGTAHLDTEDAVVTLAGVGAAPGGAIGIGRDQPQQPVRREPDRPDAAEITDEVIDRVGCSDAVLDRQLPEPLTAERDESSVAAFSGSNASPVPIQRWPSGIPPPTGRKAAHPAPPPLTQITCPFTLRAGPARKATVSATSAGVPIRSIGFAAAIWSIASWVLPSKNSGVAVGPGATALTVMSRPRSSRARIRVRDSTAPLEAAYAPYVGICRRVTDVEKLMIAPPLRTR